MTTLLTIPRCSAFHIPTPTSSPLPLASGDLTLNLLPADPPSRIADTITLSVGGASFALATNSPVQRTQSQSEHPAYVFTPAVLDGGQEIGQVRVNMKDSHSPDEWESTETLCAVLESELKAHDLWEDKELFVNDEYETGWGESVTSAFFGAGKAIADRVAILTHTGTASDSTLPTTQSTDHGMDIRKYAEQGWEQATIAAKGIGSAAVTVSSTIGQSARQVVEQGFGNEINTTNDRSNAHSASVSNNSQ